jgi:hypothetical protein
LNAVAHKRQAAVWVQGEVVVVQVKNVAVLILTIYLIVER